MRRLNMKRNNWIPGCLAAMVALLVACSTDTPTAPVQVPSTPTPAINAFILSITVSPESVEVGSPTPATVTVKATHRDTGANVANGTSIVVSTTLGEFQEAGSGVTSVAAAVDRGKAKVFFYAGAVIGTASLRAELSGSVGRADVAIMGIPPDPVAPFITSLSPSTGPASGGQSVTLNGTRFSEPMRVRFGGKLATVRSVTDTQVRVTTPAANPEIFPLIPCVINGVAGSKKGPASVDVRVEIDGVPEAELSEAYTYLPSDITCFLDVV
jgi:hypothetical protein